MSSICSIHQGMIDLCFLCWYRKVANIPYIIINLRMPFKFFEAITRKLFFNFT